ncbi:hypothetical protein [Streptacidiphilus sp. MAP12-20]|uniref:PH domain-containing protein n=1 Tax=Streptacidiphilus sp. MAP12-20 TaxID=3156299 RepID=UPI0035151F9A
MLVLALATLVNHGWSTTTLTPEGMVLASLTSRRTVPWNRINRIEVRRRTGRYGTAWMEARILLADAPPLRLPGLQQAWGSQSKEEFQDHVGVMLRYWQQETGRTEAVLVRP